MNEKDSPVSSILESSIKTLPKLLSDKPESVDFFGAHTGIAKALADLVLSDSEGRCVAIEGAWGSGKSTVIGMLKDKLHEVVDIFFFDTWSNQGDPLRFSFLIEFASWVTERFPRLEVESKKWLQDAEDTARKMTREERGPSISKPKQAQRLVTALLIGMPLGLALASDQWARVFGSEVATIFYFTGITLIFLPMAYLVWLRCTKKLDIFKEIVDAIQNAADDTKHIMIRRGPLATSLEFHRQLSAMCDAIHKYAPQRKLLIIFDNIDRVAEINSPRIWSLLTTLLETVHDNKFGFASNIWVLVPVDLDSVPVPISISSQDTYQREPELNTVRQKVYDQETISLKREFIEKTFQLTVIVPPPFSVASERYFKQQYMQAFGDTTAQSDWYECYAVLRDMRGSDESFTPREIKRFINDLVGLWLSRKQIDATGMPSIPLMTFYLCSRPRISHPNDLVQDFIPPEMRQHIPDRNPIASLAALAFGGEMSSGVVLLVKAQALGVLEFGDPSRFGNLLSVDGFAEAFSNYIQENGPTWLNNDTVALAKAYSVISKLKPEIAQDICARLPGLTRDLVYTKHLTGKVDALAGQGLAYAAFLIKANKLDISKSLQAMLTHVVEATDTQSIMGTIWFDCVDAYLKELVDRSVSFDGIIIELPKKPETALQVLSGNILPLYERGNIDLNLEDSVLSSISQSLVTSANNFNLNDQSLVIIKSLRRIAPTFDSIQICSALHGRLQGHAAINAIQLNAAVALIVDALSDSKTDDFKNVVTNWMQTGLFHHHYQTAQGSQEDKANLASRLAALMAALGITSNQIKPWNQSHPGLATFQQDCNTMAGAALANAFQYLCDAEKFHDVIRNASKFNLNPFRESLLKKMLSTRPSLYSAENYCAEVSPILGELSESLRDELTKYAIEQLGVDGYLEKRETVDPNLGFLGYQKIGEAIAEPSRQQSFYKQVAFLIENQSFEWWQNGVSSNDQTLLSLTNTISKLLGRGWLHGEARKVIAEWVHSSEFMSDPGRKAFTLALMHALSIKERTVILTQVVIKAVQRPGDMTEFGRVRDLAEFIFNDREVLKKLDDIAISILIPAIDHDSQSRMEAISLIEKYKLVEKLTGDAKSSLATAIQPSSPKVTEK